ncbi:MAG: hypothetical protein EXS36_15635 [Pedosphaera sp.]|nr:hypothetical protein [Pedosphaera sp.]
MVLVQQALAAGNLGRARELLSNQRPQMGEEDIRGWEWRYLWSRSASDELFTLGHHSNGVTCVAFSPNGSLLASGSRDRSVKLWDLSTRKQTGELIQPNQVQWVAFSRTGNLLAVAASDKNVIL